MLQRRLFSLAAISALTALSLTSVGSQAWSWGSSERIKGTGDVSSEVRDLGSFESVSLAGGFKLLVRQSSQGRVEVKTDRNLHSYIETRIVEGKKGGRTLEISPKRGYEVQGSVTPEIVLDMAQLRSIAVAGSGDVRVEAMKTGEVDASVAGSGDVLFADLSSERLGVKVAGSGTVTANGRSGSLSLSIAGSGDVRARGLLAEAVKVSIAGSGDAEVNASKTLKVSIAGSGDVGYVGSPELSTSMAGSGRVRRLNGN